MAISIPCFKVSYCTTSLALSSLAKLLHVYYPTAEFFLYHANQRLTCICHVEFSQEQWQVLVLCLTSHSEMDLTTVQGSKLKSLPLP